MPGGRLTQQDRELIAAGLAEGVGYAEIARQLDRPTSTVSREVARNGGAEGYRAEVAHRSTGRRARRAKPAPAEPASPAEPTEEDADLARDFADRFAELLARMGVAPMAARVLGHVIATESGSSTAAELVARLRVSPASISKAVGYLEGLGIIRRERDGEGRRERYVVGEDLWYQATIASARFNAQLAEVVREGAEAFGADTPTGARLADMGQFLAYVDRAEAAAVDHWRQAFAERRAARAAGQTRPD
jgi:predicted transcriptional regulator